MLKACLCAVQPALVILPKKAVFVSISRTAAAPGICSQHLLVPPSSMVTACLCAVQPEVVILAEKTDLLCMLKDKLLHPAVPAGVSHI